MNEKILGRIINKREITSTDLKEEKGLLCSFDRKTAKPAPIPLPLDTCGVYLTGKIDNGLYFIVIDFDIEEKTNIESFRFFPLIFKKTFCVKTGGGGYHIYFFTDKNITGGFANIHQVWREKGIKRIDIKGEGGLVVAPPTKLGHHKSKYEVIIEKSILFLKHGTIEELVKDFLIKPSSKENKKNIEIQKIDKENQKPIMRITNLRPCIKHFIDNIKTIDFAHIDAVIVAYDLIKTNYSKEEIEKIFTQNSKSKRPGGSKKMIYQIEYIEKRIKEKFNSAFSCSKIQKISDKLKEFCENNNCYLKV